MNNQVSSYVQLSGVGGSEKGGGGSPWSKTTNASPTDVDFHSIDLGCRTLLVTVCRVTRCPTLGRIVLLLGESVLRFGKITSRTIFKFLAL